MEDNIRTNLREIGLESVDWMYLAQHEDQWPALVNTIMSLLVPQRAGNFLSSCVIISYSRRTLLNEVI
jgi:hypothetical protein